MHPRIRELTREMDRRIGASDEELDAAFLPFNFKPPTDYVAFMRETNGSEGTIGSAYLAIYAIAELVERNQSTRELEPGLLFFATDRGGEGYAFESDVHPSSIVAIEFADLDRTRAKHMGNNLMEFLESLSSSKM